MCLWGFRPGLRQPGLFTTKDRIKFGTLSRVLGSWNWGLQEENTLGFRKLGAKKRVLGSLGEMSFFF